MALDTASSAVTAGLLRLPAAGPPELLAERVRVNARAHGELLMPAVCEVLASAGVSMRDLDAVVCGVGPGMAERLSEEHLLIRLHRPGNAGDKDRRVAQLSGPARLIPEPAALVAARGPKMGDP